MFTNFSEVLLKTEKDFLDCINFYNSKGLRKSNKQLSEDLSGLLETNIENTIEGAVAPKVDSEPDIRYNGVPVEIKCTSGEQWRGGAYSKRDGYYLMVTWNVIEGAVKLLCYGLNLTKKDWQGGLTGNYYGTTFGKKQLMEKVEQNLVDEYRGRMEKYSRGGKNCIKVIKE